MRYILTESQYIDLLNESISPCPEGKKEDTLITLDQVRKGIVLKKGYCNSSSNSALVKIQTMMQKKGILDDNTSNLRYNLLQVPNDTVTTEMNVINQIYHK
jgi:hypothetical protein